MGRRSVGLRTEKARIGIMGAGAVGSLVGGLLSHCGHQVVLIGRPAHMAAIKKDGLCIHGQRGDLAARPMAATDASALADCEVVLLTVKSQDTRSAAKAMAAHLSKDTIVVSLQNAVVNADILAKELTAECVVGGVVLLGATYLEPGHVSFSMDGCLLVGEIDGSVTARLERLAQILSAAIKTEISDDIRGALWAKLLINLDLPIYALTGLGYPDGLLAPPIHHLSHATMSEGRGILEAATVGLGEGTVRQAMESKAALLQLPHVDLVTRVKEKSGGQFLSSALQSVLRGSSSEIDYINGEIVRQAESVGLDAPLNDALCSLIADFQQEPEVHFLTPEELERSVEQCVSRTCRGK